MKKKKSIIYRFYHGSKFGKYTIYVVVYSGVYALTAIGWVFWFLSRPLVALSYLLFLSPYTAWDELTETKPGFSLKDL